MKAILMSIKPRWVAKILNREKTIEIRKKFPKDYVGWVYIYCTKDKKYGYMANGCSIRQQSIVARFWCDKVEEIYIKHCVGWNTNTIKDVLTIEEKTCVSRFALFDYLGSKGGYAIHITKLEVFDEPKEISEFYKGFQRKYYKNHFAQDIHKEKNALVQPIKCGYEYTYPLTKAPQSWCYVEVENE